MILFPNAKINLGLFVTKKRRDGMHNIETCYIPIPLFDILEIHKSDKFIIRNLGLPLYVEHENHLINKAWNLLLSVRKNLQPVKVYLYKNIPVGSGLGGGSSNVAFFLKAINSILSLGFSLEDLELMAAEIGADCPFFIRNTSVIASGIGNILTPIENPVKGMHITVIYPNINVSTTDAFTKVKPDSSGPDLISVLNGKKSSWQHSLKNDFEDLVFKDFPETEIIKQFLYKSGASFASLTGSGSAFYGLSEKPLCTKLFEDNYRIWKSVLV